VDDVKHLDIGLKDNWKEFKDIVQRGSFKSVLTTHYFVFNEDDCDEAYVFHDHDDLDKWLAQSFWDRDRYDTSNLEDSMDDYKVWKLISESEVNRLKTLYKGSKPTSIVINGERYYRKLIPISVEPTIIISTNWY
jgi:hypothetical protein